MFRSPALTPRRLGTALAVALAAGVVVLMAATGGLAAGPTLATPQPPAVLAAWVELGPDGVVLARAVTAQAACPPLVLDAAPRPMAVRAQPAPPAFPVLVCEAEIPAGAGPSAAVGGVALPLPRESPRRIVVIGDTGCRLKEGDPVQACNDPAAWPFARVARSAAAWQPDLVIHVGDYLYREDPCPPKHAGCAGSPWGDTWAAWHADLFAPAAPLLRQAPWVVARGNHELCSRGGAGWLRFLEPRPFPAACADYTSPYALPLGDLRLLMLDAAVADDRTARPEQVETYRAQYAALWEQADVPAWLVQHRPLWAIGQSWDDPGPSGLFRGNPTLQAATENVLPAAVHLVLSGHIHNWTTLSFADGRASQLVVGNSGTALDVALSVPLDGLDLAGTTVARGSAWHDFGFMTLERTNAGWQGALRAVDGSPVQECALRDRQFTCAR